MTNDNPEPLIELKQITKVFLEDEVETQALVEINMIIEKGEFVTIAGPPGCGKSTLPVNHRPPGFS